MRALRRLKKVAFACGLSVALAAGAGYAASKKKSEFSTKAQNAILMDSGADLVLFEKGADNRIPPASMSKLMTLAVVFRELKAGRIRLDDTFTVSEHAWRTGGAPSGTAAMFAPLGNPITVADLIQGVAVQSANDGALILAEGIGGTEEGFVKMMNDYAEQIGLTGSNFVNPTGLPAEGHLMTPRDLAKLSKHIIETYPEFYPYFAQKEFRYRDKFTFRNRNPLVWSEVGVDGLKTGYTKEAGYGLVSSAKRGDQRLILVVTGLEKKGARETESRRMLEWGFKSFRPYRLFDDGQQVSEALVWGGDKHYVPLVGDGAIDLLLPTSATGAVSGEILYEGPIKAPIKKGDQIATLKVKSADLAAVNEIPLYAGENIDSSGFAMRGIDSLLVLAFGWLL